MNSKAIFFFLFFIVNSFLTTAQTVINLATIVGEWQVMDSKGNPAYYVEIKEKDGLYIGVISNVLNSKNPEKIICTQCSGQLKNKSVLGLSILTNMERGETKYGKGYLLDYEKGNSSPCTIWMESEGVIKVRTWWLFLYRTHAWYRV